MRKAIRGIAAAVAAVGAAVIAPSAANAAPPPAPALAAAFTGNDLDLPVTHNADGTLTVTLTEPWNVGDCQQLQGATLTLTPVTSSTSFVEWRAFLLTRHTNSRDIWFEDVKYFTGAGSQVANTASRMHGPDMHTGEFYSQDSFHTVNSATSLLAQVTRAHLHADC
jgi:hypothetical protein